MQSEQKKTILFYSEVSDPSWPDRLQAAFPHFDVTTDLEDERPELVEVAVVWNPPQGALQKFSNLRLIVVLGAGVERVLSDTTLPVSAQICRLVDPGLTTRMTEYVLMHALALHRRSYESSRNQRERKWVFIRPLPTSSTCVGILGLGHLGLATAATLSGFGFKVVGWSKSSKEDLDFPTFAGIDALDDFLAIPDILVSLLPLTPETEDLIDSRFFGKTRHGVSFINVGRGASVVEPDLLNALDKGQVTHAVLDVFRGEPLPADHPFWTHESITITPHNSSATNPSTALEQIIEAVRLGTSGGVPPNLVDRARGY